MFYVNELSPDKGAGVFWHAMYDHGVCAIDPPRVALPMAATVQTEEYLSFEREVWDKIVKDDAEVRKILLESVKHMSDEELFSLSFYKRALEVEKARRFAEYKEGKNDTEKDAEKGSEMAEYIRKRCEVWARVPHLGVPKLSSTEGDEDGFWKNMPYLGIPALTSMKRKPSAEIRKESDDEKADLAPTEGKEQPVPCPAQAT